jgi:two-component system CheB/CheR fusion protein
VDADAARLAQVIGNLLANAAKFTDPGGRVALSVAEDAGRAVVRVADTGVGMAPDLRARAFEPFVQAEGAAAGARGGLGLGLALVKGLVELHGGTVEARSDGPGRGAELIVTLPLGAGETQPAAPAPVPPSPARRVLVVEDNRDASEMLRIALELEGHEVEVAHDAAHGLERARAFLPDVVICDVGLPDRDGYALARDLRAEPALARVRLVALTGYAQPEDRRRAADAGFDAHLGKPVAPAELERALHRAGPPAA